MGAGGGVGGSFDTTAGDEALPSPEKGEAHGEKGEAHSLLVAPSSW